MKLTKLIAIMIVLFIFAASTYGNETKSIGTYLLPKIEAEALLVRWLQSSKFSVTSISVGGTEIVALSEGKYAKFSILPYSPLATEIMLLDSSGIEDLSELISALESFLISGTSKGRLATPEVVRSLTDAVVCINDSVELENKLSFTGFLINQRGGVLSIAHDLNNHRLFNVVYTKGRNEAGRVIKRDAALDLSVLETKLSGQVKFIQLENGRSKMNIGERIFMLGCRNGSIQIQEGIVDKPRAEVAGQTLIQVKLENVFLGSSGSPVVDEDGRLIGVVKGRYRGSDSRGFLVPFDVVRSFMGIGKK